LSLNIRHNLPAKLTTFIIPTNNTMNKLLCFNWTQMCQIYFLQ